MHARLRRRDYPRALADAPAEGSAPPCLPRGLRRAPIRSDASRREETRRARGAARARPRLRATAGPAPGAASRESAVRDHRQRLAEPLVTAPARRAAQSRARADQVELPHGREVDVLHGNRSETADDVRAGKVPA